MQLLSSLMEHINLLPALTAAFCARQHPDRASAFVMVAARCRAPPSGGRVVIMVAALIIVGVDTVTSHCGVLHPARPSVANNHRVAVATCSKWAPLDPALSPLSKVARLVEGFGTGPDIKVEGDATLWMFLRRNCSGAVAVGLELDLKLTGPGNRPPRNLYLDGYVHTGGCSTGGRSRYFFYPTLQPRNDVRNMLFMQDIPVPNNSSGLLAGNLANDGPMRLAEAASFVLYNTNTTTPLACCDLVPQGPPDTNWDRALDGQRAECNATFSKNDCPLPPLNLTEMGLDPATAAAAARSGAGGRHSAALVGGWWAAGLALAWLL